MVAETAQTFRRTELPSVEFIFGSTPGMREIRTKIEHASKDDFPVLIEGESGTGKEVIARFLHDRSSRRDGPFVKVNCGAVPARLLEAEMFGYERGTSGTIQETKNGSLGVAAGGTLFLDEIGEMDLTLQQKLLGTIKTGFYGRQDSREQLGVNARFVCASSRDLRLGQGDESVAEELLRCFAHRACLSPLRERKQDIPQLCEYLVEKFARNFGRRVPRLSPYVMRVFEQWNWPGNIRELENWIARIVIFGTEEAIGLEFRRQLGLMGEGSSREHRATNLKPYRVRRMRRRG
ncbi:MAG TPA: sigma 54-interacting transcriptional regulator [Terracidiphilus sp.]|jgi:transcriptional regulator with PAS, ATPase and Fis domain